jgi:ABC-type phosphate transport system substrate-binding protein
MRINRRSFCALLPLAAFARAADSRPTADFAVIASPDVPLSNLTLADLRKIFLGDRQFWTPKLRVLLLIRSPVARERAVVVWTVCKMSEAQFAQHWIGKVMRAECTSSPQQFSSNPQALNLVSNTPGAIAIVNAAQVPAGAKILAVEGKLPHEPGYRLQIAE